MTERTTPRPGWARPLETMGDDAVIDALVELFERGDALARQQLAAGFEVLVVLVSRRLSCIYEMLVAEDFEGFAGCTVVSDRALQGGVSVHPGQHVIVIDDALILGTTLVDTYDDLVRKLDGDRDRVTALVALIDRDRHNPAFVEHLGLIDANDDTFPLMLEEKELRVVAESIARSLYRTGRPYFTDFPLLKALEVPVEVWERLLASDRWLVFDVTAPAEFGGADQRALSFFPRGEALRAITTKPIAEAVELLDAVKVRVYERPAGPGLVSLRIVPMGLPGPMMPSRLSEALAALRAKVTTGVGWSEWKAPAQHRLLQMYLSSCVLAEFWPELGLDRPLGSTDLDEVHVRTYFGPNQTDKILSAFDAAIAAYAGAEVASPNPDPDPDLALGSLNANAGLATFPQVRTAAISSTRMVLAARELVQHLPLGLVQLLPPVGTPGAVSKVDGFWVQQVLVVFGAIDEQLEQPQERQLRELSWSSYQELRREQAAGHEQERYIKLGITLSELGEVFSTLDLEVDDWTRLALSLAIDIGNDLGIVVPTTVCRPNGPVYRQYRSGEMAHATNRPHQAVVAEIPVALDGPNLAEALWAKVDRFTAMLLDDAATKTPGDRPREAVAVDFLRDVTELAKVARRPEDLVQVWIAEVTEVDGEDLVIAAESAIVPGETISARLPRWQLPLAERDIVEGDALVWTIFAPIDITGRPQTAVELRRLTPATD